MEEVEWGKFRRALERELGSVRGYALVVVDHARDVHWGADYSSDPLIQYEIFRACRRFAREAKKLNANGGNVTGARGREKRARD